MNEKHKVIALFVLVIVFGYVSFTIVIPFLSYVLIGLLLAFLVYPVYTRLQQHLGETFAALLCILIVFLLLVVPSLWLMQSLLHQATNAVQTAQTNGLTLSSVAKYVPGLGNVDVQQSLFGQNSILGPGRLATFIPQLISGAWNLVIGVIIFLMVMFYALKDGHTWFDGFTRIIPIRKEYKKKLQSDIEQMTKMLFYGQILNAIIIGSLAGFIFWFFHVPDPVFWGFIMMIFTFLPLVGAPIIYVPAGIILAVDGAVIAGIMVIVLCTLVMLLAEYIIRPNFISHTSALHPLTVVLGAIGGIYALGFVGFLIGPLILGIFITLLSFDFGTD